MTWDVIAGLIINYGLPFAEKMVALWSNKAPVTTTEWDALKALAGNNARTQMLAALARAGIDPNSPQGVALLSQVPA